MAHHVEWDSDRQLLICTASGTIDGPEVCAFIEEAARGGEGGDRPPQKSSLDVYCDYRRVRGLSVAPSDMVDIVAHMRRFASEHPYGRTAIVTRRLTDQVLAKLLVRMTSEGTRDRKQFDSIDEAKAWITQSPL